MFSAVVDEEISNFDTNGYRQALASNLEIPKRLINLSVTAGSIRVDAVIALPAAADTSTLFTKLLNITSSPAVASAALGVSIVSVSQVALLPASSPPPPAPESPPPSSPLPARLTIPIGLTGGADSLTGSESAEVNGGIIAAIVVPLLLCCVVIAYFSVFSMNWRHLSQHLQQLLPAECSASSLSETEAEAEAPASAPAPAPAPAAAYDRAQAGDIVYTVQRSQGKPRGSKPWGRAALKATALTGMAAAHSPWRVKTEGSIVTVDVDWKSKPQRLPTDTVVTPVSSLSRV